MQFKPPKDDSKYKWTEHVKRKMMYYGISESLIKRIVRVPTRIETGVAPDTTAVMQPRGSKTRPQEVWVMYQELSQRGKKELAKLLFTQKRIISAWRYPGVSKPGNRIPIPDEIAAELEM